MTDPIAIILALVTLALIIVWRANRPDRDVLRDTRERREMQIRAEQSERWPR